MPETVILHVLMHCEGCINTVKHACARIPGVAAYRVDYPAQKVTVSGDVDRDEVLKRILKTGKHAELLPEELKKQQAANKEDKKEIMGEESALVVQTVILKVVLHCEGCARTVKRAVKRIPGVTAYDVDFPGQTVTVTGVVTPEDVYRHVSRTGKITVLVPPPPPPPPTPQLELAKEEPPKAEEPKAEEPKGEDAPAKEAKPAEEPKTEEAKAEEPKKEEEAKKEEPAPIAEEKKEEENKPKEATPEGKKEEALAPVAEEKKEAKPDPPPPPAKEKPTPPTLEELFPVTFVLGPDYTKYYYY